MAERRRDARLGERLRRVGRLERARPRAARARCCRCSGGTRDLLATAASGRRSPRRARTPQVVASRWTRRRDDAVGAREPRRRVRRARSGELEVELPAGGIAAFVGSELRDGRGRGRRVRSRRARRCACRRRSRAWATVPDGFVEVPRGRARDHGASASARRARTPRRRSSRSGSRCRRGCTPSPRWSATRSPRRGSRSRGSRCPTRAACRSTGLTLAEARAVRGGARRAAADRGRVAARGRGGPARAPPAARLELDGERALRRHHALRDPQGRLRLEGRGLGLVRRRRRAGAGVLAEAAARRRPHAALDAIGFRLAVDLP